MLLVRHHLSRRCWCVLCPHLSILFGLIGLEKDHLGLCYLSLHICQHSGTTYLVRTHTHSVPYTNIWVFTYKDTQFPTCLVSSHAVVTCPIHIRLPNMMYKVVLRQRRGGSVVHDQHVLCLLEHGHCVAFKPIKEVGGWRRAGPPILFCRVT